jgi:alpha-beta hydrolase superfamily lysophospholipase
MKNLFFALIGILLFNQTNAQDIAGSWQGSIAAGGANLRLVFNIKKTSDTSYIATFDSPDQKAFGIACSKTYKLKDSLFIGMAIVNGGYKGLWDGKDGISGTFKQGAFLTALNMTRVTASNNVEPVKELVMPQTPKPPFNYVSNDVEYDNADKSLHYGATFTRPKGDGKYPAVIIITGSGTQDRDGTLFGHKLYWVLADYLTKNGIAVLRVDDRGAGKSSVGNNKSAVTSADFSYDVEASLNYLETRSDVDKKHLGLIGHSEGGIIAPMVAARRKDVNFIVLWGAPELGGAKLQTAQSDDAIAAMGIDSVAVNAFKSLNLQILDQFASSANKEVLDQKVVTIFDDWKKAQSPKVLSTLWPNGIIAAQDLFKNYNSLYDTAWWHFFIVYDPAKDLSHVKCSVLAIDGSKDTQVDAKSNLARIREILTKNGNKDFETKELPGLNHLLQTATTGDVSEYEKISETMSPDAMKIISDWIKIHTK